MTREDAKRIYTEGGIWTHGHTMKIIDMIYDTTSTTFCENCEYLHEQDMAFHICMNQNIDTPKLVTITSGCNRFQRKKHDI